MTAVRHLLSILAGTMLVSAAGPVYAAGLPDALVLGRDLDGDPCTALVTYNDPQVEKYDRSYTFSCRSAAASRWQGQVMAYSARYSHPHLIQPCGKEEEITLKDVGKAVAQQCYNSAISQPIVMVHFRRGDQVYVGEAVFTAVAPMETALKTLAGLMPPASDRYMRQQASFDPASLPPVTAPKNASANSGPSAFNAEVSLRAGIQSNQEGAYFEASQTLNGAISRLNADARPVTRAEFELEAALADSNIGQGASADAHFATASALLQGKNAGAVSAFLLRKQSTYQALDAINRKQWARALDALRAGEIGTNPLSDPATLSALNQSLPPDQTPGKAKGNGQADLADNTELKNELLEAQRYWAAGVAWWGITADGTPVDTLAKLPDIQPCPMQVIAHNAGLSSRTGARGRYYDRSAAALDCATGLVNVLQRNVNPSALLPIKARIQRQYGRLQRDEFQTDTAIRSFDCALAMLEGGDAGNRPGCVFSLAGAQSSASAPGAFAAPIIAATQFERANLLNQLPRSKMSDDAKIHAFSSAVDSLLAAGNSGETQSVDLENYLDLLARDYNAAPRPDLAELYFRAVQSVGEPQVARQVAQLQKVVTADPALASKVRDRDELQRRVIQLRYQLDNGGGGDDTGRAAMRDEQRNTEAELSKINFELGSNASFNSVNDQPVMVEDVRKTLRSGEYYLKVTLLKTRAYGIVVSPYRTWIYRVGVPGADARHNFADDLRQSAARIRLSIRDGSGQLHGFDVRSAYYLYSLITGPVANELPSQARALIIDPSGPLENLPAGTLVFGRNSVKTYYDTVARNPNNADAYFDYSHVDFLARRLDIFYALSPRSLLISRSLPPSRAPQPFIGFGENAAPPPVTQADAGRKITFGSCSMDYPTFLGIMAANKPVSAHEITLAANALGAPQAPEVTGEAFTDIGLMDQSNKGAYEQYQVVHFATHGLPETQIPGGCGDVPPSLITTVAPVNASGQIVSDGFLTFPDVAQMRFDANLVVLSACDTAAGVSNQLGRLSGQEQSGATLDGLVRAFITARARSVLATYWQVPASTDTDELIQTFYKAGRLYTISDSLSIAQRSLINRPETSHPYFWGAYVLIGDGSKTMLTQPEVKTASR